jgi:hypothetical protein
MLAICLCFKDSAAYLDEWLRFHHVQGFRRFYLYNNESTDGWAAVVRPWVEAGLAVTKDFPGKGVQARIYDDCLAVARGEVEWLAFIDDDEFLFPTAGGQIGETLKAYAGEAGVAINWLLYGSSGAAAQDGRWVIERFTRRAKNTDPHVKCIVRPDRIERCEVIGHAFRPTAGHRVVDENFRPMDGPLSKEPSSRVLRLNHYLIKSWEEWRFRRTRPQANTGAPTTLPEATWRERDTDWSAFEDSSALRYLESMRALRV